MTQCFRAIRERHVHISGCDYIQLPFGATGWRHLKLRTRSRGSSQKFESYGRLKPMRQSIVLGNLRLQIRNKQNTPCPPYVVWFRNFTFPRINAHIVSTQYLAVICQGNIYNRQAADRPPERFYRVSVLWDLRPRYYTVLPKMHFSDVTWIWWYQWLMDSPHKGSVMRKSFTWHEVFMDIKDNLISLSRDRPCVKWASS